MLPVDFDQIPLHKERCKFTTFITRLGRYAFSRLTFSITSTPEIFQRKIAETLQGLKGTEANMVDILVHGETEEIHDRHMEQVSN